MNKPPASSTASDFFTLAPMILKPKSQGTVKLRSADMVRSDSLSYSVQV